MNKKTHTGLQSSGTDMQLRQVLSHLQIASPTEGNAVCQACGEPITEGESVTLYIFRPAGQSSYTVGQCRCGDHNGDLTSLFTLGVGEMIVDGRIGQCRDQATQQTWAVLIHPSVRLISGSDTTTGRVSKNVASSSMSWGYGEQLREQVTDDQGGMQDSSEHPTSPTSCQAEIQIGGGQ